MQTTVVLKLREHEHKIKNIREVIQAKNLKGQ